MTTVTKRQLWIFLTMGRTETFAEFRDEEGDEDESELGEDEWNALNKADIKEIIADQDMSENSPGGDDMVSLAEDVLTAVKEGYTVVTWYGDSTEALVAGVRPDQITVTD